jgi:hypothetical protein
MCSIGFFQGALTGLIWSGFVALHARRRYPAPNATKQVRSIRHGHNDPYTLRCDTDHFFPPVRFVCVYLCVDIIDHVWLHSSHW